MKDIMKRLLLLLLPITVYASQRAPTPTPVSSPMHRAASTPDLRCHEEFPDDWFNECKSCKEKDRIIIRLNHQIDILEQYIKDNTR